MAIFKKKKPSGVLYIGRSSFGDEPSLFLETLEHPDLLANKKYVTFKVQVVKPKSQK